MSHTGQCSEAMDTEHNITSKTKEPHRESNNITTHQHNLPDPSTAKPMTTE